MFLTGEGPLEMDATQTTASETLARRTSPPRRGEARPFFWENILALVGVHAGAVVAVAYALDGRAAPQSIALGAAWFALCMLSTTAGYHRLFAHRSYKASAGLRMFYLLFGAASGQGPILVWASDHRTHHVRTDTDDDPHNIRRGFWWAHVGWLLYRSPPPDLRNVRDLREDRWVLAQRRFYVPLLVGMGFGLPTLIAASWGDPVGGLLMAGFLRLAVQYQATFCINSVAHRFGRRPYSKASSARDSALAAILTFGEGYHNYHHRFPADYRNGVRAHHFDPTKWWIWTAWKAGLASNLRRVPTHVIRRVREENQAEGETPEPRAGS